MKKVFLLLRNNHQIGPYTLDELLQQNLKPLDLVWEEGSSHAWAYPTEIPCLKVFFREETTAQASLLKQTDSLPNDEIEQRAEELRHRVLATSKTTMPVSLAEETLHVEALRAMARERIEFIDHRKKESPFFEWMSAAMVMFVVVAGVYGGSIFFKSKTSLPIVADKAITVDNHEAKAIVGPANQPAHIAYQQVKNDTIASSTDTVTIVKKQRAVNISKRKKINIEALPATAIQKISSSSGDKENPSPSSMPALLDEPKNDVQVEPEPRAIVTDEPVEKKKRGFLKSLFRKKKKAEEKPSEQDVKAAGS